RILAAFGPCPAAQAYADVRTVRDLEGAHVAVVIAENAARHATQFRHRRIVGMNADADALLLCYRNHLLDEVGVVLPEFFFGEFAPVRQRRLEHFAGPITLGVGLVKGARRGAATRGLGPRRTPDAIAHVGVGGVGNAGLAQVAQILLVLLDLLVAPGQIE